MVNNDVHIIKGRIITENVVYKCDKCSGERNWRREGFKLTHVPCGKVQDIK